MTTTSDWPLLLCTLGVLTLVDLGMKLLDIRLSNVFAGGDRCLTIISTSGIIEWHAEITPDGL